MKRTKTLRNVSRIGVTLVAASLAAAFSSCNSSSSSTSAATTPAATPCTNISNCTASATGYTFPDGVGGTVSCGTSGYCTDSTYAASYNSGYAAGDTTAAYNTGYNDGYNPGYNSGYSSGYNTGYNNGLAASTGPVTKDTDLQRANIQQASVEQRAQFIANSFQMSVGAATQLTQLSDRVKQMAVSGQMTDADRAAVTKSALDIAGVSTDQVNDAITRMNQGDESAAGALMQKAAVNLGMPSSAALRDKLLPAFGISLD